MIQPGRKYSATDSYRYGFNGKEKDEEVSGEGTQYDYGFRIYDPRVGRFKSVDPLTNIYPYYTPYQFAGNKVIVAIDLDGLEEYVVIYYKDQNMKTTKIMVRAVFDDDGTILNQHVHKVGSTEDIAKGNVLVFEIKKGKDGKESMTIVENRNIVNGALTKQEAQIFDKNKVLEPIKGEQENLLYQTDNPKKVLYESQYFENATTKTYKATFGIAPPQTKPKAPAVVEEKQEQQKAALPPKAPSVPDVTFSGSSFSKGSDYNDKVKGIADWLINNTDYNLQIISGGVGRKDENPSSWDTKIPSTTFFGFGGTTYGARIDKLFEQYKNDILNAGGGKISPDRLTFDRGQVNSTKVYANPIKKP